MLDLKHVLANFDTVAARLARRGGALDLSGLKALAQRRKELLVESEALRARQNAANDEMKALAKAGGDALAEKRAALKELSTRIKELDAPLAEVEAELARALLFTPNTPLEVVPDGADAAANVVVHTWGEKPRYGFRPKTHDELGEALGLLDFDRAAKLSGARFAVLKGPLAQLERALVSFMIDVHVSRGYTEILPPYLVNRASMTGTGQLPKFEEDAFKTREERTEDELFLIPTAEVPVTNLHRDGILDAAALPLRYCAFTPCFRREAGSYGKDTKGLIRQHQFHKVELVKFCRPEESEAELEKLTDDAEEILRRLGLHHRRIALCAGDLGFSSAHTYDLEVWLPGQDAFREISSCSNFEDYQARRAKIRFKEGQDGKPKLAHTLNGSGLAVGRTLVAILEQGQREDGSVALPEVLWPYLGGRKELRRG